MAMTVSARKNIKVNDIQISKHDEGILRGVVHDGNVDEDYYIVEFKEHGTLKVHKNDFDILNIR
jgi:hypothetical protein